MQKKNLSLLMFVSIICISTANASSIATITAQKSPVWLQQDNSKTELHHNSKLKIGDSIVTGDTGRVEMRLWVNATLRLNSNSEITIRAGDKTDISIPNPHPELYIHHGRACINYVAGSSDEKKFIINLGDRLFAAIHLRGDICIFRRDGLSAIKLRAGSVQVTHSVDPNTLILSETGTEFHIEDNGSFELLFPGSDDVSTLEIEKPFIVETVKEDVSGDALDMVISNNAAPEEPTGVDTETAMQDMVSDYIYTVYLFSTRSEEVAEQVNQKFQKAGHDTQIYASQTSSGSRYRVAVSGFQTKQAAKIFSDSVIGTLGVKETWIGEDIPPDVRLAVEEEISGDAVNIVDGNSTVPGKPTAVETETTTRNMVSGNIYTVYLFSSQSKEVAEQVNQGFQQAGHDSQIFASETSSGSRYRVAVSGFESRQAAKNFSDSVVGTLGVTGTWIGKDSR
jgi:cell division septation protein DedD